MAINYYDDAIVHKLKSWIPDNSQLRILKPDETQRLFEVKADDTKDAPVTLPMITLSRKPDIEILSPIKQERSFKGLKIAQFDKLAGDESVTALMNVIPIKAEYQLDIWTKKQSEAGEYVRNFLFKLINNPLLIIEIPYNNMDVRHTANIRVLPNVADTSDIAARIFPGQFTRWTIQFELHDAFLFSIPYRQNWSFIEPGIELADKITDPMDSGILEPVSQTENEIISSTEQTDKIT